MTSHSKLESHSGVPAVAQLVTWILYAFVINFFLLLSIQFYVYVCLCMAAAILHRNSGIFQQKHYSGEIFQIRQTSGEHTQQVIRSLACICIVFDRLLRIQQYVQIIERAHTHE